jgi:galactokinase
MGEKGNLLKIDCRTKDYTLVPFGGANSTEESPIILVTNSKVKHALSGSEYPERVLQCKQAVEILQKKFPLLSITALRDVDLAMLKSSKENFSEVVYRRAKHSVTEDFRTLNTVEALKNNNFEKVGEYMYESHESLKSSFEVSCTELDLLVDLTKNFEGVYGSRMTGGFFLVIINLFTYFLSIL